MKTRRMMWLTASALVFLLVCSIRLCGQFDSLSKNEKDRPNNVMAGKTTSPGACDAFTLSYAFSSSPGSSNWDPAADVNGDGIVNILDAILFANEHPSARVMQFVHGDRIYDSNGKEVTWRGVGASYLLHAGENYLDAWQQHLSQIQAMSLNTIRLAFRFPDSNVGLNGSTAADTLNYSKLDNVLSWMSQNGLKAILDCHNYDDMFGDFGSQKLINDWVDLANRFKNETRIAAYELFNEPNALTRDPSVTSKVLMAQAYQTLTREIREVDSEHIVVWQAQPYLPVFDTIMQYLEPNVVYTVHRWYFQGSDIRFQIWNSTTFSYANVANLVDARNRINAPFWLGEFGCHWPYVASNSEWPLTNETLLRCEEQMIGWNLWFGDAGAEAPWTRYLSLFPLHSYSIRQPWVLPLPNILGGIASERGADLFEPCQIELWHNNDQVTFNGLSQSVLVITDQTLSNGTKVIADERHVSTYIGLTIVNHENTASYPGDWKVLVLVLR